MAKVTPKSHRLFKDLAPEIPHLGARGEVGDLRRDFYEFAKELTKTLDKAGRFDLVLPEMRTRLEGLESKVSKLEGCAAKTEEALTKHCLACRGYDDSLATDVRYIKSWIQLHETQHLKSRLSGDMRWVCTQGTTFTVPAATLNAATAPNLHTMYFAVQLQTKEEGIGLIHDWATLALDLTPDYSGVTVAPDGTATMDQELIRGRSLVKLVFAESASYAAADEVVLNIDYGSGVLGGWPVTPLDITITVV